jgi:hypothetical protein
MDSLRGLRGQWDRVAAIVLTLAGAVCLILGWFGVAGQGLTSEQIPYVVSGGLGGIFLMGVGAALWLSSDLRDEWTKLDRIEKVLDNGLEQLGLGRGDDGRSRLAPLNGNGELTSKAINGGGSDHSEPDGAWETITSDRNGTSVPVAASDDAGMKPNR